MSAVELDSLSRLLQNIVLVCAVGVPFLQRGHSLHGALMQHRLALLRTLHQTAGVLGQDAHSAAAHIGAIYPTQASNAKAN